MKNSRRDFLKGSSVAFLALSCNALSANALNDKNANYASYFIKDLQCESMGESAFDLHTDSLDSPLNSAIQPSKILSVNGDISDIYAELKRAFESKAIVAGQSSEATFFVLRTMAAGYGLRVAYSDERNGVRSWILAPTSINI